MQEKDMDLETTAIGSAYADKEAEAVANSEENVEVAAEENTEVTEVENSEVTAEENTEIAREEAAPEYVPSGRYEAALYRVYRDKSLSEILRISSIVIVLATIYMFLFKLAELFSIGAYMHIARLAIITAIPFVIVSIARKIINAPRPYDIYPFYEVAPKSKKGSSFPSRHVFSVFVIAAALIPYAPISAALLGLLGVLLATMRILLGIHFIRDTVAGALLGIVSGVIGLAVTYYII